VLTGSLRAGFPGRTAVELHSLHLRCAQRAVDQQLPAQRLFPGPFAHYREAALSPAPVPYPTTPETLGIGTRGHRELPDRPQLFRTRSSEPREGAQGTE